MENIMIDCSHGNSQKDPDKQLDVLTEVARQIEQGNQSVIGVMLESNLVAGNQPIPDDLDEIIPGVSITDACIGWQDTETVLRQFAEKVRDPLQSRSA